MTETKPRPRVLVTRPSARSISRLASWQLLPLKPCVSTQLSPVGETVISIVLVVMVVMVRRHLRRGS